MPSEYASSLPSRTGAGRCWLRQIVSQASDPGAVRGPADEYRPSCVNAEVQDSTGPAPTS